MKRTASILLAVLMTAASQSQVLPKKCYMRLQGYLNDQIEVSMNLIKADDSLYADYYLTARAQNGNALSVYFGTPRVLGGKMAPDGSFTLRSPFDPDGTEVKGKFVTRQTLSGSWIMEKGKAPMKFSLSENYPAGSRPLGVWFQTSSKPIAAKVKTPRAFIQQCLVVPTESSDPVSSDTVRSRMMTQFSSGKPVSSDPQAVLDHLQKNYFASYLADNLELYQQKIDAGTLNWDLYKLVHIVFNEQHLLSFYIDSYAFTGGAHGLGSQDFSVIDMKSGNFITLADFLIRDYEAPLTGLLTAKLKTAEKLQPGDRLSEKADYFTDDIPPSNNFYIAGNGIGFFYNHYEIAPYAHGFTDIFLTFDEIASLIRPGSILSPLLK